MDKLNSYLLMLFKGDYYMIKGKSGMGSHKHYVSGYSTQSPRFRYERKNGG